MVRFSCRFYVLFSDLVTICYLLTPLFGCWWSCPGRESCGVPSFFHLYKHKTTPHIVQLLQESKLQPEEGPHAGPKHVVVSPMY